MRNAAIAFATLAISGLVVVALLTGEECFIQEYTVPCSTITAKTPALAVECEGTRQLDVIHTPDGEPLIKGATPVGHRRSAGKGVQCPEARITIVALQSNCIGGHTRSDPEHKWRWGQCCGDTCECEPGKRCPMVPRSVLAGSGAFERAVCKGAKRDYPERCKEATP